MRVRGSNRSHTPAATRLRSMARASGRVTAMILTYSLSLGVVMLEDFEIICHGLATALAIGLTWAAYMGHSLSHWLIPSQDT